MTYSKLKNIKTIHMIGIGGISMSAIALMLKNDGFTITGSDQSRGDMIDTLEKAGITIFIGSDAEAVSNADLIIYTAAIKQHDPEFVKAKELKKEMYERATFLGMLMENYEKSICIAGTHGKTTTTSMVASCFLDADLNPTIQVGAKLKKIDNLNYHIGGSKYFILEACEYVDSFLNFPHQTAVILNIDADHLDYFNSIADIRASFKKFIMMLPKKGVLIINSDDPNCKIVLEELKKDLEKKEITIYTFGMKDKNATFYGYKETLTGEGTYTFTARNNITSVETEIKLGAPGTHNIYNALSVMATCFAHNINENVAAHSLLEFSGASRRFEYKKTIKDNVRIFDDYAHHPTEIKATLEAAKNKAIGKVIAIFQPHTFSRTRELLKEFSEAFYDADYTIITDIYAAREIDDGSVSSVMLVKKLEENNINAHYISSFEDIVKYVTEIAEPNDIVLTIGAGTITKLGNMFCKEDEE
ncbi:MAG: UDP-N-acetylmuramate--L-alanine ligase [Clostridia bacterium]